MSRSFWKSGEPFIWATGAVLLLVLVLLAGLIGVVFWNGCSVFWPKKITQFELKDGRKFLGEITRYDSIKNEISDPSRTRTKKSVIEKRIQINRGNRDIDNMDFVWLKEEDILRVSTPADAVCVEREENGKFIGFIKGAITHDGPIASQEISFKTLKAQTELKARLWHDKKKEVYKNGKKLSEYELILRKKVYLKQQNGAKPEVDYEKKLSEILPEINSIQYLLENKVDVRYLVSDPNCIETLKEMIEVNKISIVLKSEQEYLEKEAKTDKVIFQDMNGVEKTTPIVDVIQLNYSNQMTFFEKISRYCLKIYELFFANPRESNTEGGLFPAIVGTVMMVFLMSFLSFPLGVISGIYLREYAKENFYTRIVRIAVNNLAGIPSIVYGIFGFGFFVYIIGSNMDSIFYPVERPKFGTSGILWASLTLGILTVPVVIVSTEEALGAIPRDIRQGSLALGATKFQTLYGVLLPMASPGILTGFILAMSRAAGEVAPLMITGVVKTAHALPIDGEWPFIHLDRKFMHLAYQVYDVGFQSPNVEASTPMVYVTTLLLLTIVFSLSLGAILLRNKMKKRYTVKSF